LQMHALFQYIFDLPVYPSKILLCLFVEGRPLRYREISEKTGISHGKVYQTVPQLRERGLVDTSQRGLVKLNEQKVEETLRHGVQELLKLARDIHTLRLQAIKEQKTRILATLKELEQLEKTVGKTK